MLWVLLLLAVAVLALAWGIGSLGVVAEDTAYELDFQGVSEGSPAAPEKKTEKSPANRAERRKAMKGRPSSGRRLADLHVVARMPRGYRLAA